MEKDTVIKFDVGGKIFKTFVSTVTTGAATNSLFKNLMECQKLDTDSIFLNRDPIYFRYILNYLRNPETFIPPNNLAILKQLKKEADYYLLPQHFSDLLQYVSPFKSFALEKKEFSVQHFWENQPLYFPVGLLNYFEIHHLRMKPTRNMKWKFNNHEIFATELVIAVVRQKLKWLGIRCIYQNESHTKKCIEFEKNKDGDSREIITCQRINLNPNAALREIELFWHIYNKGEYLYDIEIYGKGRKLRIPFE